jgi:hypothetical protein
MTLRPKWIVIGLIAIFITLSGPHFGPSTTIGRLADLAILLAGLAAFMILMAWFVQTNVAKQIINVIGRILVGLVIVAFGTLALFIFMPVLAAVPYIVLAIAGWFLLAFLMSRDANVTHRLRRGQRD